MHVNALAPEHSPGFRAGGRRGRVNDRGCTKCQGNPRDFCFRLAGSEFKDGSGQDLTGRLISEAFPPEFNAEVQQAWSLAVERRQPKWGRGRLWVEERDFVTWEGVVMPLQNDNSEIHQLLGAAVFHIGGA